MGNAVMSLQLPFALLPTLTFTCSPKIMGEFANGMFNKVVLSFLSLVIVGINLFFVGSTVSTSLPHTWWIYTIFGLVGLLYLIFVGYLSLHLVVALGGNLNRFGWWQRMQGSIDDMGDGHPFISLENDDLFISEQN